MEEFVETFKNLTRDTFLCEQNIQNIAKMIAKETYKKHETNAKSVRMWVRENPNIFFYYQETGTEVSRKLSRSNISFTIGIQTPW